MAEFAQLMTTTTTFLKYMLGALLLGAAGGSLAVSLGAMRGNAIVGQPFNMSLTAQLSGSEGLSAVCVYAEIFFGDSQIPPSRVSIATVAGVTAHEALIRIRTESEVNEPVVTVLLREGCLQSSTRRYVVLADIQTEGAVAALAFSGEVVSTAPVTAQSATDQDSGDKSGPQLGAAHAESVAIFSRKKAAPAKASAGSSAAEGVNAQPANSAGLRSPASSRSRLTASAKRELIRKPARSRLKLDPLDLASDQNPVLRASMELLTLPTTDAQQRVAAAALWQALNAQPQDLLRNSQRLKSLETDVAKILAQSGKTGIEVRELRAQLDQARGERYSNWLVYALSTLLALGLLTAGLLWARGRGGEREFSQGLWWYKERAPENRLPLPVSVLADPELAAQSPAIGSSDDRGMAAKPAPDIDLDLTVPHVTNPGPHSAPGLAAPLDPLEPSGFSPSLPSLPGVPRIVNAEELSNVQHQVDFFMSVGHFDKAVDVLRLHLSDNVETSTLAYLDLFALYHRLGRKDDYELLQKDFNLTFNAAVPVFDEYTADSQGLEFYASALARIESLWQTPRVLNVIEETIFRKPDSKDEVFSLAAYRELLMLYSIARETSAQPAGRTDTGASGSSAPSTNGFSATHTQPLSAELVDIPVPPSLADINMDLSQPPASYRLGLDIDLSRDADD
jgi:hypothetical protein